MKEHKKKNETYKNAAPNTQEKSLLFWVGNRERERKKRVGGFGEEPGKNGDIYKERKRKKEKKFA